jgi:hypothetical protein
MTAQLDAAERVMKSLETTIRDQLVSYLTGDLSLDEFTAWLVGATWNIENVGEAGASQLAYAIELALAEHSSGLLSQDELRRDLLGMSQQVNLNLIA